MAHEFKIKNGLQILNTHPVYGISDSSTFNYDSSSLVTEKAIQSYIDIVKILDLADVSANTPQDKQIIIFDGSIGKFKLIDTIDSSSYVKYSYLDPSLLARDASIKWLYENKLNLAAIQDSKGITGFTNNEAIDLTYDYDNRTITASGDLTYYFQGTKYQLTSPWTSPPHDNLLGPWFLYSIDGSSFIWTQTPWSFEYVMVAYVDREDTSTYSFGIREVHGLMDYKAHEEFHSQISTYRVSGGLVTSGTYELDTETDAAITPGFNAAYIKDEDITTYIPEWNEGTYTTMYVNATDSSSVFNIDSSFPFLEGGGYIYVNNVDDGTLVPGINNRYYNVYQILMPCISDENSQRFRTVMLQPQRAFTSLVSATGEDLRGVNLGGLNNLSPEFFIFARLTYYTNSSFTTTGQVELAGITYNIGSRAGQISVSGVSSTDHQALSNLTWANSGHVGRVNHLASFNNLGQANYTDPSVFALLDGRAGDVLHIDNIVEYDSSGVKIEDVIIKDGSITSDKLITSLINMDVSLNLNLTEKEGDIWWNYEENTLNIATGLGSAILQTGQEVQIKVYNDSGEFISNNTAVYPTGSFGRHPTIGKALSKTHETINIDYGITTTDIPNGSYGFVTWFGKVRGINTLIFNEGDPVYISPYVPGEITNIKPKFPYYAIQIGIAFVIDSSNGEIFVTGRNSIYDTFQNFWNGIFRESVALDITSDGSLIYGNLYPENINEDTTMIFSDGFSLLDTSPGAIVELTQGSKKNPQQNFIYIPQTTKTLTASTTDWPTEEHIKIGTTILFDASTTEYVGPLKKHVWNDALIDFKSDQGHLSNITERLRQEDSRWDSGVEGSVTINTTPSPDDVWISVTGGKAYQLHKLDFPSLDTSLGDYVFIPNHFTNPYEYVSNLNTQTQDSQGNSLSNRYFSFVLWGVISNDPSSCKIMLNLPRGSYLNLNDAINDPANYSVYNIPKMFKGTGFLISRFTFQLSSAGGGNWTLHDTEDLRGFTPNTTAGSGAGGGSVNTFLALLDTPSSYSGHSDKILKVSNGASGVEFTTDIKVNSINEYTLNNGIDIEDVSIKDGNITLRSSDPYLHIGENQNTSIRNPANLGYLQFNSNGQTIAYFRDTAVSFAKNVLPVSNEIFNIGSSTYTWLESNIQKGIFGSNLNYSINEGVWFGDGDTGFYENADDVLVITNNNSANIFTGLGYFQGSGSSYFRIKTNTTYSSSVPYYGNLGDVNTGLGFAGSNYLSLIAGSNEILRIDSSGTSKRTWLNPNGDVGDQTGLWFGDGDTGFYESSDDLLRIRIAGTNRWFIQSNIFGSLTSRAAQIIDLNSSSTLPTYTFAGDLNTGIGSAGDDQLSLIAGGVEIVNVNSQGIDVFSPSSSFTGNLVIDGSLMIYGDLFQDGSTYVVHAENINTEADFITMRDGAVSALPDGSISGLKITLVDGINNVVFGAGNDAVMRVGWEGDALQAIATREDSPINKGIAWWDDSSSMFKTDVNLTWDPSFGYLGVNKVDPIYEVDIDGGLRTTDNTQLSMKTNGITYFSNMVYMRNAVIIPTEGFEITNYIGTGFTFKTRVGLDYYNRLFIKGDTGFIGLGSNNVDPCTLLNLNGGVGDISTGLSFGDGDTGIYENQDDYLYFTTNGIDGFYSYSGNLRSSLTNGWSLVYDNASNTQVTFRPRASDVNSGIGSAGNEQVSIIGNAKEITRFDGSGDFRKLILNPDGSLGINTGLWFGDGDTGFYEKTNNNLAVTIGGKELLRADSSGNNAKVIINPDGSIGSTTGLYIGGEDTGFYMPSTTLLYTKVDNIITLVSGSTGIYSGSPTTGRPIVRRTTSDNSLIPGFTWNGDLNTGMAWGGTGVLSLVADGIIGAKISNIDSSILINLNGSVKLEYGASVNNIETILTDNDSNIPTSGAVIDAISGFVDGTGDLNKVAIWSDSNTLTSSNDFTFFGGALTVGSASVPLILRRRTSTENFGTGLNFQLFNSAFGFNTYGSIYGLIEDNTSGAEYGKISFYIAENGSLTSKMSLDSEALSIQNLKNSKKITVGTNLGYDTSEGLWFGDGDSGFYEDQDDRINCEINGNNIFKIDETGIYEDSADNFFIRRVATTSIIPSYTWNGDANTGLGRSAEGQLSLIGNGYEILRIDSSNANKVIVNPSGYVGSSTGLWFGDGDTGIFEDTDDKLRLYLGGTNAFIFKNLDQFAGANTFSGSLRSFAATSTQPVITFEGDENTGLGRAAIDQLSLIAGGVEGIRISETDSSILINLNGSIKLEVGASVNEIETTLTDDDTHLPTSGAVYDFVTSTGATTITNNYVAVGTGTGIEGTSALTFNGTTLTVGSNININTNGIYGPAGDRFQIKNQVASTSNATFRHYQNQNTGIGGDDQIISFIVDNNEMGRFNTTEFQVDTITEYTTDSGVTIEGVELKDSELWFRDGSIGIYADNSNLYFKDISVGVKTLSNLIGGGSSITFGNVHEIPVTNSSNDGFNYYNSLKWDGSTLTVFAFGANLNIGQYAGEKIISGEYNTNLGGFTGGEILDGDVNTNIGFGSGWYNVHGYYNTLIGGYAGLNLKGSNNTMLGTNTGFSTDGSGNLFLGYQAGYFETGSNKLYIHNSDASYGYAMFYGEFDTGLLTINASTLKFPFLNESLSNKVIYYDTITGLITYGDPSSSVWGNINGTLSDQTDISTALDEKLNTSGGLMTGVLTMDASIMPLTTSTISIGSSINKFKEIYVDEVFISNNSLYVNGKKVISDESDTINITTDENQDLLVKTSGTGDSKIQSDNGISLNVTNAGVSKDIELNTASNSGSILLNATGAGGQLLVDVRGDLQLFSGEDILLDASTSITSQAPISYNNQKIFTSDRELIDKGYSDARTDVLDSSVSELFTSKLNNTTDTFSGVLTIDGSLMIYGDLFQDGSTYVINAENIDTKADFITMREGAVVALSDGSISGLNLTLVDGINNVVFGAGNDAVMRVGWEGDSLQAVATREDNPINNAYAYWDDSSSMFKTYDLQSDIDSSLNDVWTELDNIQWSYDTSTIEPKDSSKSLIIYEYQYMGSPNVDGSWRFYVDASSDLVFEKRVSGTWIEGGKFTV